MATPSRVAIVTGAGTGIGRACAQGLLEDGWSVVYAGRRPELLEQAAGEAAASMARRGHAGAPVSSGLGMEVRAIGVPTDVRDPESVRALFGRTKEAFGRLDLLFNNAGVFAPGVLLEDLTYEQWQTVVETNVTGAFLCTQEAF